MFKFILQLFIGVTGFIAFFFVASLLEPVFTNPIVFVCLVGFVVVVAVKIAVRSSND
jgi:hypothetical protein